MAPSGSDSAARSDTRVFVAVALMSLLLMTAVVLRVRSIGSGLPSDFAALDGAHSRRNRGVYVVSRLGSAEVSGRGRFSGGSFVAQTDDRVESRGAICRVVSEKQADAHRDRERDTDPHQRYRHG